MNSDSTPPVRFFTLPAFFLNLLGWGGLFLLVKYSYPTVFPRWLFFFLLIIGIAGLVLPVVAFFNRRFQTDPPATSNVIVREASWFGLFAAFLAWLQMGRVLTPIMVILMFFGFLLIEFLLRLNERSQWKP